MTVQRRPALRVGAAAALLVVTACSAPLAPDDEPEGQPAPSPARTSTSAPTTATPTPASTATRAKDPAKKLRRPDPYVVAVSVDGLNPSALRQLGPEALPNFFALITGGAGTLNARTELEQTETLPNHTSMLTGRPVRGPRGHGVQRNTDPGGVTVSSLAGHDVSSVFDVVHARGLSTAMYAAKTKFALLHRSWRDSIDRYAIDEDNGRLTGRLVKELRTDPARFTFVHLSAPDAAGHDRGFMGPAYLAAVRRVDGLLGEIRAALAASPALRRGGHLLLTADHGGRGTRGHADPTKVDDYRIPFLVDGPSVPPGDLYALNPDYRDPGTGRPSYDGPQPVRNGDLADLSTRLLGLPPVPGSFFGAVNQLDVR